MTAYWKRVAARLFRLSRAAVNAAIPPVLQASLNTAYDLIEQKLRQIYKKTIRNAAITLAINVAGMLILIFHPFGTKVATWLSMPFFTAAFIFWLVRLILYCKNYGRVTLAITKNVFRQHSLSKGISRFITEQYPLVTWTYAGIDLAATQFSALKEIPRLDDLVKLFIQNFYKRIALFVSILAFYTITVYWIIKPILINYAVMHC
jgi:hypothetical protein